MCSFRPAETYEPFLQYFAEKKYFLVFKETKQTKKPNQIFEIIEEEEEKRNWEVNSYEFLIIIYFYFHN